MSATTDRPVLLVTPRVPPERVGALAALSRHVPVEVATFGGRGHHFTDGVADPGVPHHRVSQSGVGRLVRRPDRWRAVICGTAGRIALPAAWCGARDRGLPFVLWSAMWHEPRTPAFLAARHLLRRIVRDADAVAAYGSHVEAHVAGLGAQRVHIAPQSVDPTSWVDPPAAPRDRDDPFRVLFVGRDTRGKGVELLLVAWRRTKLHEALGAELVLVGPEPEADGGLPGVHAVGACSPTEVRDWLDRSDVLCVPSERTRTFLEPWGLVCNEAMHRGVPVVATDVVGAAAGGLVRDRRNGRVVGGGDVPALSRALTDLAIDPSATRLLGVAARHDAAAFTYEAWASGMAAALEAAEAHAAERRNSGRAYRLLP